MGQAAGQDVLKFAVWAACGPKYCAARKTIFIKQRFHILKWKFLGLSAQTLTVEVYTIRRLDCFLMISVIIVAMNVFNVVCSLMDV